MRIALATLLTLAALSRTAAGQHDSMHGGTAHDSMHRAMHGSNDSAFAAMQARGNVAMGVDQYTSQHHFEDLADGGRITLERTVDDPTGVSQIRSHMKELAREFQEGDFVRPFMVHDTVVPGTTVMKAKRAAIIYSVGDTPTGGYVRITTQDADALRAIHDFLAFQRREHHAN